LWGVLKVQTQVNLVFHNNGLRSYIEVDLCARCPRQDDKGCCGFYSPVFYATDLVYLDHNQPDLLQEIFSMDGITVLDASVTVNQQPDDDSYRCRFHSRSGGCRLPQNLRESVCRHFVCPDIGWEKNPHLLKWKEFFEQLADYEISLNNGAAEFLQSQGLTLRNPADRQQAIKLMEEYLIKATSRKPAFFDEVPAEEAAVVSCELRFGKEWTL
jgi:hypothetical protein